MFASVCPPQPEGGSLFMLITHNISIELISKTVITIYNIAYIISSNFCFQTQVGGGLFWQEIKPNESGNDL